MEAVERAPPGRQAMFVAAVFVGLASGSNYVYSGYAPQLASKLGITSTDSNLVGLGGNLGMYLCGPLWGLIVDKRGPRIPLLCAGLLNFIGYTAVRMFYNGTFPIRTTPDGPASRPLIFLLTFCMFLTGMAGSAGLSAAMNAVAKSYPDRSRAAATGSVLAGFGLSAFLFSTMSQVIYSGEAGGLLLLLSIGTMIPDLIGVVMVRAYPLEHEEPPLFTDDMDEEQECALARQVSLGEGQIVIHRDVEPDHELEGSGLLASPTDPLMPRRQRSNSTGSIPPTQLHYTPWDVFQMLDFHLIFIVLALLCGVGLEWINNVGAVTLALARNGWEYDRRQVSALQARQVATISIFNCAGRVLGGLFSDHFKLRYGMKRIWFLPLVALMFLAAEISAIKTTDVHHLWMVSASLGLAYGSLFNVIPMLVLEWFGMSHFSQNFGYVTLAPVIGGNIFNLVFGRVYDSNTVARIGGPEPPPSQLPATTHHSESTVSARLRDVLRASTGGVTRAMNGSDIASAANSDSKHECLIGVDCYALAFKVSALGCIVALGLSVFAGIRRQRLSSERKRHG